MRAELVLVAVAAGCLSLALLSPPARAQGDRYQPETISAEMAVELTEARAVRRAGDYDAAISRLQSLVDASPDYYLAWYNLGLAQAQAKQVDAAADSLERALELKESLGIPDDTIYNSLGWTHYLRGDYGAAKPVLEKAVQQEGLSERSRTRALNNLGTVLLRLQEFEDAESALLEAKDLGSSRAQVNLKVLGTARSVAAEQKRGGGGG
ncbi:MAG: tetratricopeptide repeat protein [Acidobacteriota bacterium]